MIWLLPRDIRERVETKNAVLSAGFCRRTLFGRGLRFTLYTVANLSDAANYHAKVTAYSFTNFLGKQPITAGVVRDGWLHVLEMALEAGARREDARRKQVRSR